MCSEIDPLLSQKLKQTLTFWSQLNDDWLIDLMITDDWLFIQGWLCLRVTTVLWLSFFMDHYTHNVEGGQKYKNTSLLKILWCSVALLHILIWIWYIGFNTYDTEQSITWVFGGFDQLSSISGSNVMLKTPLFWIFVIILCNTLVSGGLRLKSSSLNTFLGGNISTDNCAKELFKPLKYLASLCAWN